ncbi:ATP-binding protein [Salimicrobium sp. PL1-032A]|uniref:ATP-binding protein n=1 Tax=Salimicrobium sp. PL1-032A TaxID=3095364 RepID=UPI0032618C4E
MTIQESEDAFSIRSSSCAITIDPAKHLFRFSILFSKSNVSEAKYTYILIGALEEVKTNVANSFRPYVWERVVISYSHYGKFIENHENAIFYDGVGANKTYTSIFIGLNVIQHQGKRLKFYNVASLVSELLDGNHTRKFLHFFQVRSRDTVEVPDRRIRRGMKLVSCIFEVLSVNEPKAKGLVPFFRMTLIPIDKGILFRELLSTSTSIPSFSIENVGEAFKPLKVLNLLYPVIVNTAGFITAGRTYLRFLRHLNVKIIDAFMLLSFRHFYTFKP